MSKGIKLQTDARTHIGVIAPAVMAQQATSTDGQRTTRASLRVGQESYNRIWLGKDRTTGECLMGSTSNGGSRHEDTTSNPWTVCVRRPVEGTSVSPANTDSDNTSDNPTNKQGACEGCSNTRNSRQ